MSGPKCGEWSVESNLDRERRIAAELRASIVQVQGELDAVRVKWQTACEEFGEGFPGVPSPADECESETADNDTLRATLQRLRSKVTSWVGELAEADSTHRIRGLLAAAAMDQEIETGGKEVKSENMRAKVAARKEKLSTLLSSLNPMLPYVDRSAIEALGKDALKKVDGAKFESLFLDLRFLIQKFNARQNQRARNLVKAQALLDRLAGLDSPEVLRLRHELLDIQRGEVTLRSDIAAEVATVATAAAAEDDRRYASKVLLEELERLGYSTRAGMETVLVQGGELEISKPDLKEYSVCFSVSREGGQFDVHLARAAENTETVCNERQLRDRSMEEKWCADLASALFAAAERGVVARVTKREKPGVAPVAVKGGAGRRRSPGAMKTRSMRLRGSD